MRLLLLISPSELPQEGGTAVIYVETSVDGARVAPHIAVSLSADGGTPERDAITTDGTGHASLTWSGTSAAIVTARAGDLVTSTPVRLAQPAAANQSSTTAAPVTAHGYARHGSYTLRVTVVTSTGRESQCDDDRGRDELAAAVPILHNVFARA